jgi:peptidoglycan hydrolase-like protein with peptidoglycan-binding domain
MKRKQILSILILAAAVMAVNPGPTWSQSVGGSQNERSGSDTQTPVAPTPPDPSKAQKGAAGTTQSSPQGKKDSSVGGIQSERSGGDSQTPLPKSSPSAGSADPSQAEKGSAGASKLPSGTAQGAKDTSVGGSQSERTGGDTQTPVSKGSRSAGSNDPSSGQGPGSAFKSQGMGRQDVQQAQEALKNQGHDPGPIDGIMGSQTRQALRDFQSKNGLRQTGMLNAETKQKLNIEGSSSAPSPSSATRPAGSDSMKQKESASPMSK